MAAENGNGHHPETGEQTQDGSASQPTAEEAPSVVIFQFKGRGSSEFSYHPQNVAPSQLYAIAKFLEMESQDVFAVWKQRILEKHAEQQIAVPPPALLVPASSIKR